MERLLWWQWVWRTGWRAEVAAVGIRERCEFLLSDAASGAERRAHTGDPF